MHADAGRAAEAAICAQEQGRFWDMYHSMLANQSELDLSGLIRQAGDLGLDSRAFARCLESGRHRADWRRDQKDGRALGVSGTPTFFVNGTLIEGAIQPARRGDPGPRAPLARVSRPALRRAARPGIWDSQEA